MRIKNVYTPISSKVLKVWFIAYFFSSFFAIYAQDGAAIFQEKCFACHTVGGGRRVGPDLKGITEKRSEVWLSKWIRSSTSLIKSGDKEANAIFKEYSQIMMPNNNLSDAELKALLAYISGGAAQPQAGTDASASEVFSVTPEQIDEGKQLFLGSRPLRNAGVACISCHNVNYTGVIPGGSLAKDLTAAYGRLGGSAGIKAILDEPPFAAMKKAYKDKPISDHEIAALTAFLYKVNDDTENQAVSTISPLLSAGVPGSLFFILLLSLIWYARKKNAVKKDMYDRQIKSIK